MCKHRRAVEARAAFGVKGPGRLTNANKVEFIVPGKPGTLYIVATPIGNLDDISRRAEKILSSVDLILAEDTRHSRKLLNRLKIKTPLLSCHERNEDKVTTKIIARLVSGCNVALIADAGTPLISDPGFKLVRQAHGSNIAVSPVPGPTALIAALSASGIPPDRFLFEGFVPEKTVARRKYLQKLAGESRTMIFYEAPHRIKAFLDDAVSIFGAQREASIARELTKKFETIRQGKIAGLTEWLAGDADQGRGEFVVIIAGNKDEDETANKSDLTALLSVLLKSLTLKQSVQIATELSGAARNEIYDLAIAMQKKISPSHKEPDSGNSLLD